ncbi:hypothetical protein EZ313_05675 [Ramlibacter henchirensis]|uniref:Uncharacterized protein n=1 Tax=Ramlibacter henchirensis TaxID=204072 RepID=A0A4Z0C5E7_9BURK|nr:hypothetical protein [Ramlibacter henchirensis]TFZ06132.1 hypothetical protein EZ313_05675 [Ramlibacter henchirensis]
MDSLWAWWAVAAAGALHGLNPATGWALAAWRAEGAMQTLFALVPIGVGHIAAVAVVAAAVPAAVQTEVEFDPLLLQGLAAALLLALLARHLRAGGHRSARPRVGQAGLALWSFIVGTVHGAGWLLVPALVPLCAGGMPGREITASGSLSLALAAVGVHLTAMLATTAAMAAGARRGLRVARQWLDSHRSRNSSP